jgi:hypothetical protein
MAVTENVIETIAIDHQKPEMHLQPTETEAILDVLHPVVRQALVSLVDASHHPVGQQQALDRHITGSIIQSLQRHRDLEADEVISVAGFAEAIVETLEALLHAVVILVESFVEGFVEDIAAILAVHRVVVSRPAFVVHPIPRQEHIHVLNGLITTLLPQSANI